MKTCSAHPTALAPRGRGQPGEFSLDADPSLSGLLLGTSPCGGRTLRSCEVHHRLRSRSEMTWESCPPISKIVSTASVLCRADVQGPVLWAVLSSFDHVGSHQFPISSRPAARRADPLNDQPGPPLLLDFRQALLDRFDGTRRCADRRLITRPIRPSATRLVEPSRCRSPGKPGWAGWPRAARTYRRSPVQDHILHGQGVTSCTRASDSCWFRRWMSGNCACGLFVSRIAVATAAAPGVQVGHDQPLPSAPKASAGRRSRRCSARRRR